MLKIVRFRPISDFSKSECVSKTGDLKTGNA